MVEYAATQGISDVARWLMMHPYATTQPALATAYGAIVMRSTRAFRVPRPANSTLGVRHRPGLRDGVRTFPLVRPDGVAPQKP